MEVRGLEDVPVVVENDVNALAIHGYWARSFEGIDVAVVAVLRLGVGGALILNGRMYRGINGMAPEPGHLAVEFPQDCPGFAGRRPSQDAGGFTFDDECMCSIETRKIYGHVDAVATPGRIQGELAARRPGTKVSFEEAAQASRTELDEDTGQELVSEEAKVIRRAGRGLGRGLAQMINILNPGQFVLYLPKPLAEAAPMSSGALYLEAAEHEINNAYSTGPSDARGGKGRLTIHSYADDDIAEQGAVAAATTVFNAFTEHARGRDGCPESSVENAGNRSGQNPRRSHGTRSGTRKPRTSRT